MAKVFNGSLIMFGADEFPHKWIKVESLKVTPKRLQDLDPFNAEDGTLHRNPVANEPSTISFETPPMLTDEEVGDMMAFIRGHFVNAKQRDIRVTFFNQYTNTYDTETMYFNVNVELPIKYVDPGKTQIVYDSIQIDLIGY